MTEEYPLEGTTEIQTENTILFQKNNVIYYGAESE
jgi:hypothetical protein